MLSLTVTGTTGADTIRIVRDGNDVKAYLNSSLDSTTTLASLDQIVITGGNGNDTMQIDLTNGSPLPSGGLSLDLGAGTNEVFLTGGLLSPPTNIGPIDISTSSGTTRINDNLEINSVAFTGSSTLRVKDHRQVTIGSVTTSDGSLASSKLGTLYTETGSLIDIVGTTAIGEWGVLYKNGPGTLNLLGPQDHDELSSLEMVAGTINIDSDCGEDVLVYLEGDTTVNFRASQHLGDVAIMDGATARLTAGGNKVMVINGFLNIEWDDAWLGRLDMNNNDLIIRADSGTREGVLENVVDMLTQGFNSFDWDGNGIASSAALFDPLLLTGMGILTLFNDDGFGSPMYTSFAGETVGVNDILVKYTYYGDANIDGEVDGTDAALLDNGYNQELDGWECGDFDYSGAVDGTDYTLYDNADNYGGSSVANQEPHSFSVTDDVEITQGQFFAATAYATDAEVESSSLTYSLDHAPFGAVVSPKGDFSWLADTPGEHTIRVVATDNGSESDTDEFEIRVDLGVLEDAADSVIDLGRMFASADLEDGVLTYSVYSNSNSGLVSTSIVAGALILHYLPNQNGTATITMRATDGLTASADSQFTVTVTAVTDAPYVSRLDVSPSALVVDEDVTLTAFLPVNPTSVTFYLDDGDGVFDGGDTSLGTDSSSTGGWSVTYDTGGLSLAAGEYTFFAQATSGGLVSNVAFMPAYFYSRAPRIVPIDNESVLEGRELVIDVDAFHAPGLSDAISYELEWNNTGWTSSLPSGMTINGTTGVILWQTAYAVGNQAATYQLRVTATADSVESSQEFSVNVVDDATSNPSSLISFSSYYTVEGFLGAGAGCGCDPELQTGELSDQSSASYWLNDRRGPANSAPDSSGAEDDPYVKQFGYQSTHNPHPVVGFEITSADAVPRNATALVAVTLAIDGTAIESEPIYYDFRGIKDGEKVFIAAQVDAGTLPTGRYHFVMTLDYGDNETDELDVWQNIVNDAESPFGNRRTLKELDRLVFQDLGGDGTGALLVKGTGSTVWFPETAEDTFGVGEADMSAMVLSYDDNGTPGHDSADRYLLVNKNGSRREFDPDGLLRARVDQYGNTTTYAYADGLLDTITDYAGRETSFEYDEIDDDVFVLDSMTDIAGNVVQFDYDLSVDVYRLATITLPDPDGGGGLTSPVYSYDYDADTNLLIGLTDPLGNVTTYDYYQYIDNGGSSITTDRLKYIHYPDGSFEMLNSAMANALPRNVAQTPTIGLGSDDSYPAPVTNWSPPGDYLGPLGRIVDAAGNVFHFTLDRVGELTSWTDAEGNTTFYNRRNMLGGRDFVSILDSITEPDPDGETGSAITYFDYDLNVDVNGWTSFDLTQVILPDSSTIDYTYDETFHQVESIVWDGAGDFIRSTKFEIDESNGNTLESVTIIGEDDDASQEEDDLVTQYEYNDATLAGLATGSLLVTMTDAAGEETTYDYFDEDDFRDGWLKRIYFPAIGVDDRTYVDFDYNSAGDVISYSDELERETTFAYDPYHRLTSLTEPDPDSGGPLAAPVTGYEYDGLGNQVVQIDPLGRRTAYRYDSRNRLSRVVSPDPDGGGPVYAPETAYVYRPDGVVTTMIDALLRRTGYGYDQNGQLTEVTLPDPDGSGGQSSPVWLYEYDQASRLVSVTDPRSLETTYEYSERGFLTDVLQPEPDPNEGSPAEVHTVYTYFPDGQVESVTDGIGRLTEYAYDDAGRLIELTLPDPDGPGGGNPLESPSVTYEYDKLGRVRFVVRHDPAVPSGQFANPTTEYIYNERGWLTDRIDPDPDGSGGGYPLVSPQTIYGYNDAGELTSVTDDVLSRTTTYTRDALGRVTLLTMPDPDGGGGDDPATVEYAYDAAGNLLASVLPANAGEERLGGLATRTVYDGLNRATRSIDANGDSTYFAYDLVGNMTSLADPVGNKTRWTFDNLDRNTLETNPLGYTRSFAFDASSNLTRQVDRSGRVRQFGYDNLNRQTSEWWYAGTTAANADAPDYDSADRTMLFAFDDAGQILSAADEDSAYAYDYDDLGRVLTVDNDNTPGAPNVVLTSVYDGLSRRTGLSAVIGSTADFSNAYSFDNLGRMTQVTQADVVSGNTVADKRVDFAYLADGQFDSISRYASLNTSTPVAASAYGYDDAGRLTSLLHTPSGESAVANYSWAYDTANRLTSFSNSVHTGESATYTHDRRGQLASADRTSTPNDEAYSYDANGNRITAASTSLDGDYVTGSNNQLLSDGTYTYQYDAEGNRVKRTKVSDGSYTEYTWDNRDRLVEVVDKNSGNTTTRRVTYKYDVFDRRIERAVDTTSSFNMADAAIERYVYDGDNVVLDFLDPDGDGTGTAQALKTRYLHGPNVDQILAQEDAGNNAVLWQLGDHLGTVRDVIESDGDLVAHIAYDSFGRIASVKDSGGDPTTSPTRYLFTGREFDSAIGLQYNRARWYDSNSGSWISEDPIGFAGGDSNLNRYVNNRPTLLTDSSGLRSNKEQLDAAREELQRLVDSGQISAEEARLRWSIIWAALNNPIRFNGTRYAIRNPDYWVEGPGGFFIVKPAVSGIDAINDIWLGNFPTTTGCKRAAELIYIQGLITLLEHEKRADDLKKLDDLLKRVPTVTAIDQLTVDDQTNNDGFSDDDFIPGDWVWFQNPDYTDGDPVGEEGSNTIYIGGGLFITTTGGNIFDREGMNDYISGYDSAGRPPAGGFPAVTISRPRPPKPPSNTR